MDWTLRLNEEFKNSSWSWFVTLTYKEECLPHNIDDYPLIRKHFPDEIRKPTLDSRHLQLFTKSLRKENGKHTKDQLRYYQAGEYGSKFGRPHYHCIFFNLHPKCLRRIDRIWRKGNIDVQIVQTPEAVSNYVASYIVTAYAEQKRLNLRPFSRQSKRPYLGHTYVKRMREYHQKLQEPYIRRGEKIQRLPRKFINEIFDQADKNAWKQPGIEQEDLRMNAELHRLYLLNGFEYEAFTEVEKTKIHHEHYIRTHGKKNDKF